MKSSIVICVLLLAATVMATPAVLDPYDLFNKCSKATIEGFYEAFYNKLVRLPAACYGPDVTRLEKDIVMNFNKLLTLEFFTAAYFLLEGVVSLIMINWDMCEADQWTSDIWKFCLKGSNCYPHILAKNFLFGYEKISYALYQIFKILMEAAPANMTEAVRNFNSLGYMFGDFIEAFLLYV